MDRFVQYLREKYHPRALLVYGSYVRGDQDGFSDFDCMVIVDSKEKNHDDSVVDGVQLDCYIFTADEVSGEDIEPLTEKDIKQQREFTISDLALKCFEEYVKCFLSRKGRSKASRKGSNRNSTKPTK